MEKKAEETAQMFAEREQKLTKGWMKKSKHPQGWARIEGRQTAMFY